MSRTLPERSPPDICQALTARLGELGRLKRPDLVQQLLVGMAAEGMEINIFHCSSAASAYEKNSHWHRALLLLSGMSRMQLEANAYTHSVLHTASAQASLWQLALESTSTVANVGDSCPSVVAACCSGVGNWEFVFLTLSELSHFSRVSTSVPLLLCSAAISSLGTRHDIWNSYSQQNPGTSPWVASLLVLQHLQDLRSSPDTVAIGAASSVCEKGEQWRWAQELLRWSMRWQKLRPNLITSNTLISACQKSSLWPVALHHLHEAAAASIAPDTLSFNAAISACRSTWRLALQYLKLMKIWGTQWSNISYNSGMSSEPWLQSLGMMESMRARQVQTSRVTYNAILVATERGSMWQSGAAIFATLGTIQPDVVTYASSINGYVQVDAWAAVLDLLTSMGSSHCAANTVTTTSAIGACTERTVSQRWPLAISLFQQLIVGNLRPNELSSSSLLATMEGWWQSLGSLTWMHQLGINGLAFNAAAAGCALQYQWPRCLHLASMDNSLDVVSSSALAAVCHRIHNPHLGATLLGPLQMAALETLSRHKKKQGMNSR